jgi:hypothetical protein
MKSPRGVATTLAFAVLVACGGWISAAPTPEESCTLLVRLFNDPFEDETTVPTIPLTFDARIAIRAEVEGVDQGDCGFSRGDRAVFLIHSPTRTFGGYWFHDKRFFLTIKPSDSENTAREWDLTGIDWPLDNPGPQSEVLICTNETYSVRTLVGDSARQMFGPFSVFRGDQLVVSLNTIETIKAKPIREDQVFELDFPGDPNARVFKTQFRFEARNESGILIVGSEESQLICLWPNGE